MRGLAGVSFVELKTFYTDCGCEHSYKLAGAASTDDSLEAMAKAWAKEVERVWKKKGLPEPSKKTLSLYAKHLSKAIEEGYGQKLGEIDYDSPDGNMLAHLVQNVYHFSAAKNYTQLRQLTQAMVDENGKLRTYSQFKQKAFEINDTHIDQHLKAEYELAVAGSQMASKWVDIETSGAKILEFDAVMDGRTSDGCKLLNGVRKPVNDPFWNTYYPPNHFHCRSTVRQHDGGGTTPDHQITYPDDKKVPPMFRVNLAKQKLAFPPDHPYYTGTPKHLLQDVGDANYIHDDSRKNKGGNVYESGMAFNKSKANDNRYYKEYNMRLDVADAIADQRKADVHILPELHPSDPRYGQYFKDVPIPGKLPDFKINGNYYELESYEGKFKSGKISTMLRGGAHQSDNIILKMNHPIDMPHLAKRIKGSLATSPNMKHVKSVLVVDVNNVVHTIL